MNSNKTEIYVTRGGSNRRVDVAALVLVVYLGSHPLEQNERPTSFTSTDSVLVSLENGKDVKKDNILHITGCLFLSFYQPRHILHPQHSSLSPVVNPLPIPSDEYEPQRFFSGRLVGICSKVITLKGVI